VLTHALAFALPVIPIGIVIHVLRPGNALVSATLAESYSRKVAGFDVIAGDNRAAVAGLRRHLDRMALVRTQLIPADGSEDYVQVLDGDACFDLAEIAFLAEAADRDGRVADAVTTCQKRFPKGSNCPAPDAQRVLDIGARRVNLERASE
jgi:hypothetical protein